MRASCRTRARAAAASTRASAIQRRGSRGPRTPRQGRSGRARRVPLGLLPARGVIDVKSRTDASGRLVTWEMHNYNSGSSAIRTLYDAAHQHIEFHPGRAAAAGLVPRGLAATAKNHFARESHMDEIAAAVKLDPLGSAAEPEGRAAQAVLDAAARSGSDGRRPEAAAGGLWDRRRLRERQLRRHLRRGPRRAERRLRAWCASWRRSSAGPSSTRPAPESDRGFARHGPGRRALRGRRVRPRRDPNARLRATACRASATCRRSTWSSSTARTCRRREPARRRSSPWHRRWRRDLRGDGPAPAGPAARPAGTAEASA